MKKMNASEKTTRKTQNSQPSHTLLTHTIKRTRIWSCARSRSWNVCARERKSKGERVERNPMGRLALERACGTRNQLKPPLVPHQRIISEREKVRARKWRKRENLLKHSKTNQRERVPSRVRRKAIHCGNEISELETEKEGVKWKDVVTNTVTNQVKHDLYRRISSFRFWSFGGRKRLAREGWKSVEVGLRRA